MININLDVLSQNPWVQGTGIVVGIIAALTALGFLARRLWRANLVIVSGFQMLTKMQPWMDKTDATLAAQNAILAAQDLKIEDIHHQTQENNGGSIKDGLKRVETNVAAVKTQIGVLAETQGRMEEGIAGLYTRANTTDDAAAELRKDLEDTRPIRPITRRPPKERST